MRRGNAMRHIDREAIRRPDRLIDQGVKIHVDHVSGGCCGVASPTPTDNQERHEA
jgi:hypothetical protein